MNTLGKFVIISSFWAFSQMPDTAAQEVVYVLPVPGGNVASSSVGTDGAASGSQRRFMGSPEYEENRGLWRPRARRDIFSRSDRAGSLTPSSGLTADENRTDDSINLRRGAARSAPVEGAVASGNITSRSSARRRNGQSSGGLTEAYNPRMNGDANAERRGANILVQGETGNGQRLDANGQPLPVRPRTRAPAQNTPGVMTDTGPAGPPEDFGVTAQGAIDPLTGEVLRASRPLTTGSSGQPPQSAASALTASALSGSVGAAGTENAPFVDGTITTVQSRGRPQWDPLGVRMGSFVIRPSIDVESEFTDNVTLSSNNKTSDVRAILRPAFNADSDWRRHALSLSLSGEIGRHARTRSENYVQFNAAALGRIDARRNTVIDTEFRYELSQEARNTATAVAAATRRPFIHALHASMRATQRFNRLSASLRGSIDYSDYKNNDRDYADLSLTGRLTYEIAPGRAVYTEGEYSLRRHDQRFDAAGTARNSKGVSGRLGATFELGRSVRADTAIGYIYRDYEDGALSDVSAFSASADLAWNMTPLTTLRAGISTSVDETTVANASANVVREVVFGLDHELMRNFIIGAEFTLADTKTIGNSDRDTAYEIDLNADYRINRKASLTAHVTRTKQKSTRVGGDYTEHRISLGLNLRL